MARNQRIRPRPARERDAGVDTSGQGIRAGERARREQEDLLAELLRHFLDAFHQRNYLGRAIAELNETARRPSEPDEVRAAAARGTSAATALRRTVDEAAGSARRAPLWLGDDDISREVRECVRRCRRLLENSSDVVIQMREITPYLEQGRDKRAAVAANSVRRFANSREVHERLQQIIKVGEKLLADLEAQERFASQQEAAPELAQVEREGAVEHQALPDEHRAVAEDPERREGIPSAGQIARDLAGRKIFSDAHRDSLVALAPTQRQLAQWTRAILEGDVFLQTALRDSEPVTERFAAARSALRKWVSVAPSHEDPWWISSEGSGGGHALLPAVGVSYQAVRGKIEAAWKLLAELEALDEELAADPPQFDKRKDAGYYGGIPSPEAAAAQLLPMEEAAIDLNAIADSLGLSRQAAKGALEREAANAARENTARAEGKAHPADEVSPNVQAVFGDVPVTRTKQHKRRGLPDDVLNDPDVIEAAKVIVNAHRYTAVSTLEAAAAEKLRKARAIVRRQERRAPVHRPH